MSHTLQKMDHWRNETQSRFEEFMACFVCGGSVPSRRHYPRGIVVIKRECDGIQLTATEAGLPAYLKCYHTFNNENIPCDCKTVTECNGTLVGYTMSDANTILEQQGKLFIDEEALLIQCELLKWSGGNDTPNLMSPHGRELAHAIKLGFITEADGWKCK